MKRISFPIFCLLFFAGVLIPQGLSTLPGLGWLALLPVLWLLSWRWAWIKPLAIVATGLAWAVWRADLVLDTRLPDVVDGKNIQLTAEVIGLPERLAGRSRFLVKARQIKFRGKTYDFRGRVRLSLYREHLNMQPGEVWRMTVKSSRPRGFANPGGFDYEKWLFSQHIRATGYIKKASLAHRIRSGEEFSVNRLRLRMNQAIQRVLTNEPAQGLVLALATGDRSELDQHDWNIMRATGTNHLMAISGLHIGLIALVAYWMGRWLWSFCPLCMSRLPAQKFAVFPALFASAFYALMAGFSVPSQRALIMISAAMIALLVGRETRPLNVYCLALFAVLLFDPLSVLTPGFWLSFGAVAVILYAMQGKSGDHKLLQFIRVQLAVSLGLLPLLLLLFGQFSLVAPVANIVAVPVAGMLATPLILGGVVANLVHLPALAGGLWKAAGTLLDWLWHWLAWLSNISAAEWLQFSPLWWTIPLGIAGSLVILAPGRRHWRWLGILGLLPMFMLRQAAPEPGDVKLALLDVGQGLALVVRTANQTLVYDTGSHFSDRFDAGRDIVAPYLRSIGVNHVDTLVVSHEDMDHRGGVRGLRETIPVNRILTSVPDLVAGSESCKSGQVWHDGDVWFRMLHPLSTDQGSKNDVSCVLRIDSPDGSILLTGDIEEEAETELFARYGEALDANILVVPHHGSKTSSTDSFVRVVDPRLAVVSAGYRNRFGHPTPSVAARYSDLKIPLLNTAKSGAILVDLSEHGLTVNQWRKSHRHYWQEAGSQGSGRASEVMPQ